MRPTSERTFPILGVILLAVAARPALSLLVLAMQWEALGQEVRSSTAPTAAQIERWQGLINNFPVINGTKEEASRVEQEFLAENVAAMPQEWRYAFLDKRLWWFQVRGRWNDMLAVRDSLMKEPDAGTTRSLLDADLLCEIATYFTHKIFLPPETDRATTMAKVLPAPGVFLLPGANRTTTVSGPVLVLETDLLRTLPPDMAYWMEHYRDLTEGERILQYVVDHFDPKYEATVYALRNLAFIQSQQGKWSKSLENWKRWEAIPLDEVFSADRVHTGMKRVITAAEHLQRNRDDMEESKRILPNSMIDAARWLPGPQALKELVVIGEKYKGNAEVQKRVKTTIDQMLPQWAPFPPRRQIK